MATGTRIRYNLSKGRLAVGVSTGDTTLDLGEDPGWGTLGASEYIALTLSDTEIVHVTDYTSGTSVCTVQRAQEGTSAAAHALGAAWVVGPTTQDFTHGEQNGLEGDAHPDLLNDTRHDVTDRHPIGVLGDGSGLGLRAKNYATATTTLTKADYPWLRLLVVRLIGAGGGGAGVGTEVGSAGAGGGGGEYVEIVLVPANLLASEDLTIGSGGLGGSAGPNPGQNGGPTSFGAHAAAGGGQGGSHVAAAGDPSSSPGAGGTSGYGAMTYDGQAGGYPWAPGDWAVSGKGADSAYGFGGNAVMLRGGTSSSAGNDGTGYGAGGSGAVNDGGAGAAGGSGSNGLIILEFYG